MPEAKITKNPIYVRGRDEKKYSRRSVVQEMWALGAHPATRLERGKMPGELG